MSFNCDSFTIIDSSNAILEHVPNQSITCIYVSGIKNQKPIGKFVLKKYLYQQGSDEIQNADNIDQFLVLEKCNDC